MLRKLFRRYFTKRLWSAARKGDVATMRACIANGADIGGPGGRAMPPLFLCARVGSIEGLQLLSDNGANIHHTFAEGGTVLHTALLSRQAELALYLIDHGADIHKATITGVTPMHLAALGGLTDVLRRLLKDGVNMHALTREGQSAIYCALAGLSLNATQDPSCLRLLFAAGADPRVGGQVLEENMSAFTESANAFLREQLEALAARSEDQDLRNFARRIIGELAGKMVSSRVGVLTRTAEEGFEDWWISGRVAVPFWDNKKIPISYIFLPEKDPEFLADADAALTEFLEKTTEDRLELTPLLVEHWGRACVEKGIPAEELSRWLTARGDAAVWTLVTPPATLRVQRRHRRDEDIYILMNMDCSWDKENGVQFVFRRGMRITRVSVHDGWLTEADAQGLLDVEDELLSAFSKKPPKS